MAAAAKKLTMLVVDDDKDFRESLVSTLEECGYIVVSVSDGLLAQAELKKKHEFALICSDIRMPNLGGLELFESVKDLKIPFIMMTGFSDLIDAKKAHEMGVGEFISKPFTREDLLSAIELCLHDTKSPAADQKKYLDSDYCQIHINDFIMGSKVASDVYIRLSESKYLMIARSSNPLSTDRLESFKAKGLEHLYIPKENFAAYVGFNLSLAKVALSNKVNLSSDQKLKLFKHTTEILLKDAFVNGVDKNSYNSAKSVMESTVQLISDSNDIFSLLDMLKNNSEVVYAHSVGVGVYASLIAKKLGWTSQSTLFKISMAGLFHDIGKKEIPKTILAKPRVDMNLQEIKTYESHTIRGKEILSSISGIPEEVVFAALQHHESLSGRGFPYQTPRARIQPVSRLITLGNEFCHLVLKTPSSSKTSSAHEALNQIYQFHREDVDLTFLKALMEIFEFPIPADLRQIRKFKED
jgi:putative nucleotidyltransferase with HDIG domain